MLVGADEESLEYLHFARGRRFQIRQQEKGGGVRREQNGRREADWEREGKEEGQCRGRGGGRRAEHPTNQGNWSMSEAASELDFEMQTFKSQHAGGICIPA